jgi:hypothetical protein
MCGSAISEPWMIVAYAAGGEPKRNDASDEYAVQPTSSHDRDSFFSFAGALRGKRRSPLHDGHVVGNTGDATL